MLCECVIKLFNRLVNTSILAWASLWGGTLPLPQSLAKATSTPKDAYKRLLLFVEINQYLTFMINTFLYADHSVSVQTLIIVTKVLR